MLERKEVVYKAQLDEMLVQYKEPFRCDQRT